MTGDLPDWTKSIAVSVGVGSAPAFWAGRTGKYEDTSFVTGESPRVLDVNTDLGRNAHDGYFINDGPGTILLEISDDGLIYGAQHTIKGDEVFSLGKLDIDRIRLTWVSDSAYRCLVI